ncbi:MULTISPECIES: hypothetical protein [unclassified Streptomyces]|uniref:hypothetical protein n=1 Tax=unclassified Streptomyces TaxID=2593676 RepID=UPI002ED1901B|nr:hypothetical protein OH827_33060 [Streptomyces sp. NBC_00891]WSY09562.1 hypothetical protein OG464_33065 [Streptomyces sp. NBC_00890]WSZ11182.1 hypothetical protein OG704_33065 [Streptomyces sp. NBC_00869]WSZ21312.1 hypothetical protein OG498_00500 [Streptomyces sp. NBC_00870]
MNGRRQSDEPAEHRRFAHYLHALQYVTAADEADLLAAVLRDEDTTMATSAVSRHMDRRAAKLLTAPAFTAWFQAISQVIDQHDFLTTRLHEWRLLRTLALGGPWAAGDLTAASDWLQRTAVSTPVVTAPDVLRLFAEHGRTRRVRNAAHHRLQHLKE